MNTGCLSQLELDELLAEELSPPERAAHLTSCARCRGRLSEAEKDRALYRAQPPPLPRRRPRQRFWIGAGVAAVAAAALLFVRPTGGTRLKGGHRLGFYVKRGAEARAGGPGERVRPGDTLVFTVTGAAPAYVVVVGVDARGRASVYAPDGAEAVLHEAGRDVALATAVVLDETLGPERLEAVFCERPTLVEPVRLAVERGAALPAGCVADTLPIQKVP